MNFYLKPLMLILSFFAIETVWAQPRCVQLFRAEKENMSQEALAKEIVSMQKILEKTLVAHLKAPDVDVVLEAENVAASYFLHAKFEIHLGMLRGETIAPSRMRGVAFSHEFGHAIFAENFHFDWQGKRISFKEVVEASQADIQRTKADPALNARFLKIQEIQQTLKLAKESGHEAIQKELEQMLREHKRELRAQVPHLARFDIISELTLPLNELFADSLPALFWRNPKIMSEFGQAENLDYVATLKEQLEHRGNNPGALSEPREFKPTSFKGWKREVKDQYTRMDPVRGVLWQLYMKNLKNDEIGLFMKVFLGATDLYVSASLSRFEIDALKDRSPEEINREFLRFFVEVARREGLPIRKSK